MTDTKGERGDQGEKGDRGESGLPPADRKWSVLAEKAIDLAAVVGLVFMAHDGSLDPKFAAALVALIAGVNLGQVLHRSRGGPSGLLIGIADMLLRHRGGV